MMYYSVQFSITQGGNSSVETQLISTFDEHRLDSIVAVLQSSCVKRSPTALVHIRKTTRLSQAEYHVMSKFFETFNADGLVFVNAPEELAVDNYINLVSQHVAENLELKGFGVPVSDLAEALKDVLSSCDFGTACIIDEINMLPEHERAPVPEDVRVYGPRIEAKFQPQAWMQDYAVDIDGACFVDVTAAVLSMPLHQINLLSDNSDIVDTLVDVVDFEHNGPYQVSVVEAIKEFFSIASLADITASMWERANRRAFLNEAVDVIKGPQHVLEIDAKPLTVAQMAKEGWKLDCVIALPADYPNNSVQIRAYISTVLTGRVYAMENVQFELDGHDYGDSYNAIRVTGHVSHPGKFFELGDAAINRGDHTSLLLIARELNRADVFEMVKGDAVIRYHMVCSNYESINQLIHLADLSETDWQLLAPTNVVEFIDPLKQKASDDGAWFTLEELASAVYQEDGTFKISRDGELVALRFF